MCVNGVAFSAKRIHCYSLFVTLVLLAGQVRRLAPEFYDNIPHYHSWWKVIVDYIVDEDVGPLARVKRVTLTNKEQADLKARGGLVM